jgi:hypothetical protein
LGDDLAVKRTLLILRYLWPGLYTVLGLLLGALGLALGGRWRKHLGVLEFFGGRLGSALARLPEPLGFSAMTLGHVILAIDRSALAQLRHHEHVHVRQYERWGPFFVPAYLLSSLLQLLRGRNPYRENHFERQAYALAPRRRAVTREAQG